MECISVINGCDLTVCTPSWNFLVNTSNNSGMWAVSLQETTIKR